jgi:hypothetical protein
MTKYMPDNAVVTDPVVEEITVTHDDGTKQVKNLHASGLTTAKETGDGGVDDGAAAAAQGDGADQAAGGAEPAGAEGAGV